MCVLKTTVIKKVGDDMGSSNRGHAEIMDDLNEFVVLTGEDGVESEFEFIDKVRFKGREYLFMLTVEDNDGDAADAVIFLAQKNRDGTSSYTPVGGALADELFSIFKERCKDRFDFEDQ